MRFSNLGIIKLEAIVSYSHDAQRSRSFYQDRLGFAAIGHSEAELSGRGRQHTEVYRSGDCTVVVATPLGTGGRAWRWLQRHPAGMGALVWQVEDAAVAFDLLEKRGATPIGALETFEDEGGTLRMFSITTPFGGTSFRFVERNGYQALFPGYVATGPQQHVSPLGIQSFDHVTTNFETMAPALLWLEHVMGFERYWDVAFHTNDVADSESHGSGLKSVVMWDRDSGVKLANNEPARPFFKQSQINTFAEANRGDGIQHVAMTTTDIIAAVGHLRDLETPFLPTPDAYYDALPGRLAQLGVGGIDEDVEALRKLGILVDGERPGEYLLQIFMKEASAMYEDAEAGPFFFELIQRKGNRGFGEGNFRALFESIERSQEPPQKEAV